MGKSSAANAQLNRRRRKVNANKAHRIKKAVRKRQSNKKQVTHELKRGTL